MTEFDGGGGGSRNGKRRPNPVDAHVSARLRARRLSLGMSQEDLGAHLGLTFQQIQKYEKAANRISASRLYSLAQVLGCPPEYFFEGFQGEGASESSAVEAGESLTEFLQSREGVELCRAFAKIDDADLRRAVLAFLKSLAQKAEPNAGREALASKEDRT